MVRAIRTIQPTVAALGLPRERWLCYGKIFEVGGCYLRNKVGPFPPRGPPIGLVQDCPPTCRTGPRITASQRSHRYRGLL
jgi:hypothetical protein